MTGKITSKELQSILMNQRLRRMLSYEDPLWFCLVYLRHYFEYPFAPFHKEIFHIIKHPEYRLIVMMAFRGSGKSTIMNLSNALWSILGKPQKKFVLIMSQTQEQAKNHFGNIKDELMRNELLRTDFGPFTDNEDDWKKTSLELEYHESRIMSVSAEQGVRGLKYGPHRPGLIICDDVEDSALKGEMDRRSFYSHFTSEVIPLGDSGTRIIMLGNLTGEYSFLMQLKDDIDAKKIDGVCRAYPIIDDEKRILWPDKFPNLKRVEEIKRKFPRDVWEREFLLKAIGMSRYTADMRLISKSLGGPPDKQPLEPKDPPPQAALIPQMAKFKISAPLTGAPLDFQSVYDPRYLRYYGNMDPGEITHILTDRKTSPEWNQ